MSRVYIIILNYQKWEDARECLTSVFCSLYPDYTVIVIDNDSRNRSLEHLMDWVDNETFLKEGASNKISYNYFHDAEWNDTADISDLSKLVFIQNDINKGFAGAINIILKKLLPADGYIWMLNPDMVAEGNTLSALATFAEKKSSRSITGSLIKYHDRPGKVHLYGGGKINFNSATVQLLRRKSDIHKLDYVSGGSLFTSINSFRELGLLPENYFLYWEETDWCYRAKKAGYQLYVCEKAVCYDKVSTTIGKSFLADYYYTRNGLLFLSKYKEKKIPVALFFVGFRFIKRIITGDFKRAWGVYKGMTAFLKEYQNEDQ